MVAVTSGGTVWQSDGFYISIPAGKLMSITVDQVLKYWNPERILCLCWCVETDCLYFRLNIEELCSYCYTWKRTRVLTRWHGLERRRFDSMNENPRAWWCLSKWLGFFLCFSGFLMIPCAITISVVAHYSSLVNALVVDPSTTTTLVDLSGSIIMVIPLFLSYSLSASLAVVET